MADEINLMNVLPQYFRPVVEFQQIMSLGEAGLRQMEAGMKRVRDNCFIQTCDGSVIDYYENLLNIKGNTELPLEERRTLVLIQYYARPLFTLPMLKELLSLAVGKGNYSIKCIYDKYQMKVAVAEQDTKLVKALYTMVFLRRPAHIELLFYAEYKSRCRVSPELEAAVRFCDGFYPRFNLSHLRLDRTWKLDGSRILSGYNSAGTIDLYPVSMEIHIPVEEQLKEASGIRLQQKACEKAEAVPCIAISSSVSAGAASCQSLTVIVFCEEKTEVGEITIYNQNIMNNTWKLNGKRKLNGGSYKR